jgi:acyl carrier protein
MDVTEQVKAMLIEALKLDLTPAQIADDAPLFSDGEGLRLDSLDALQLAVSVEETFGVSVPDEAAGKAAFRSVRTLADFVRARGK